jgi:hypothetical protein
MQLVYLFLVLLVIGLVLSGLLWAGTLWVQGYIYNEPAGGLEWRAPAAGAAVAVFLAVWCLLNYNLGEPGVTELPFDTWWSFSPTETSPARPWRKFWSVKNGKEVEYIYQSRVGLGGGQHQYVDAQTMKQPWSRESGGLVQAVIIEEDGTKVRFDLQMPPGGKFKPDERARYVEEDGRHRVLTEDDVQAGQMTHFRNSLFLGYVLLNALLFAVWFAAIWLLLRFQWSHALGLAAVLWLATMLVIFPVLTNRTKLAVDEKEVPRATEETAYRAERTQRKPMWDEPVSGGVPRRALGR